MQRALVTGGTGFVGSNLVAELRARGWQVRCLVRDPQRGGNLAALGAELRTGSLQDFRSIAAAVNDVDAVFHVAGRVAAIHRQEFILDNVEGTRTVMQAASECAFPPTVIMVSSLAAAGPSPKDLPRREGDKGIPTSVYGKSKLAAEQVATEFADRVALSIIRPPVVLGPGDRNGLQLFKSVKMLRLHPIPGYRRMRMSIVHVADLCEGIIQIAERGKRVVSDDPAAGTYYITSGPSVTYGEMGTLAARAMGYHALAIPTPKLVFWIAGGIGEILGRVRRKPVLINWDKIREAVASGWECSDEKLRTQLGYEPALPLEQRFVDTVAWYREHGWL